MNEKTFTIRLEDENKKHIEIIMSENEYNKLSTLSSEDGYEFLDNYIKKTQAIRNN